MPGDALIKVSDNECVEKDFIVAVVTHMNRCVRNFNVSNNYILCFDENSSRNGTERINQFNEYGCEVFIQPTNTSHLLQPCDQTTNKGFKRALSELCDAFRRFGVLATRQVNFYFACALHEYESISSEILTESFRDTGLYPFDRKWSQPFTSSREKRKEEAAIEKSKIKQGGPASNIRALRQQQKWPQHDGSRARHHQQN